MDIGKSKPLKNGKVFYWVGKKTDITNEAIRAVFEYMYNEAEETGACEIRLAGYGVMEFRRNKK